MWEIDLELCTVKGRENWPQCRKTELILSQYLMKSSNILCKSSEMVMRWDSWRVTGSHNEKRCRLYGGRCPNCVHYMFLFSVTVSGETRWVNGNGNELTEQPLLSLWAILCLSFAPATVLYIYLRGFTPWLMKILKLFLFLQMKVTLLLDCVATESPLPSTH